MVGTKMHATPPTHHSLDEARASHHALPAPSAVPLSETRLSHLRPFHTHATAVPTIYQIQAKMTRYATPPALGLGYYTGMG